MRLGSAILDAAFDHFVRHGVEGANMDSIAASAGVTKRTLYQRYKSKQGLLEAVLDGGLAAGLTPVLDNIPDGELRERIVEIAARMVDASLSSRAIGIELLLRDLTIMQPGMRPQTPAAGVAPLADIFEKMIRDSTIRHRRSNRFRDVAESMLDMLVIAPRVRILHLQDIDNSPEAIRKHIARNYDLLVGGIPWLRSRRPAATPGVFRDADVETP